MGEARALLHRAEDVAPAHPGARRERRLEAPGPAGVQHPQLPPGRDKGSGLRCEDVERPAEPIEDGAEKSGPELGLERPPGGGHRLADGEAVRVLVDLERGHVPGKADDLTEEPRRADVGQLVERDARGRGSFHQRAVDAPDVGGAHRSRTW